MNIPGIHHVTALAGDPQRNLDFYTGVLGLHLVKLTVFLRDMGNLAAYREVRDRFFATVMPPAAPAVTLIEVSRLYGADFLIEIEAIAAI